MKSTTQLPEVALQVLDRYGLPRPAWPGDGALPAADQLQDRFRGALLWGAVGDAMGRPTEARSWAAIRAIYGPDGVTGFHPWPGWRSGPTGTWTDDTQLTIELARTILESDGEVDPVRFARRLVAWLPVGRGKGRATTAAMRAAPVGLAWSLAPDAGPLVRQAAISALPTHAHRVGVAGAVAIAAGVAWCVRDGDAPVEAGDVLSFVAGAVGYGANGNR